eukprot:TRINITY_DN14388_c3_g1_i2.p1 TRINITY_DN14388_c3_g1~~TRINITY_DN14388_c3_g1_i2.p1  ORF type:complete len:1233 (-),score=231.02 TRINITY_DN14388_c3_g1_i2:95-3766(-)
MTSDGRGRLVWIRGLTEKLEPVDPDAIASAEAESPEGQSKKLEANGRQGRVLRPGQGDEAALVQTFDGLFFNVPEENLEALEQLAPDAGGFDLCYPASNVEAHSFGVLLTETVARKGYCVVQTFMKTKEIDDAIDESEGMSKWTLPLKDFETAYLGRNNVTKYALLDPETIAGSNQLENEAAKFHTTETLQRCDDLITQVSFLMEPYSQARLGFKSWGRTGSMVRIPFSHKSEESKLRPGVLSSKAYEDGRVMGHINFLETRKLVVMFFVGNDGGEIILEPFEDGIAPAVTIPLASNRMLIFRADMLGYHYRPSSTSVMLQSFITTESMVPSKSRWVASLPEQLYTEQVSVRSIACHYPAAGTSGAQFWILSAGGADGLTKVPTSRFDIDEYFSPEAEKDGCTYAVHGGFCQDDCVLLFDNQFFGVSEEEASIMSPAQRLVLQTGYEALQQAGISKATARGFECGVYLGDSGCDWPHLFGHLSGPLRGLGQSNSITGCRLAHALGLRGPTTAVDTACSSSLVAIGLAHTALRKPQSDQPESGINTSVRNALAQGCNLLLGPRMYIRYSGPHMLSPRGRCFTFDTSADGYARGEGCGSMLLKLGGNHAEQQLSMAFLIGSAVNQDGRSASMTAPNGPSQQQCIRASMVESKLSASEISVAECHGTGTALGDPIEVSALRMVMQERPNPILNTSAKTNIGHLEASAGMAGVLKCVNLLNGACSPPNNHFRLLNPHMDTNGYPVYFADALSDFGQKTGISGVSSFGFGGTNARGDLWARCTKGARATRELDTGDYIKQRHLYFDRIFHYGSPGPHSSDEIYVSGSWDGFSALRPMQRRSVGDYVANVTLGETGSEHFRLVINQDMKQIIHPGQALAGAISAALGPDANGKDCSWLINGKLDGLHAGAAYQIRLQWGHTWERGEYRRVTWQPVSSQLTVPGPTFKHSYRVIGSWTSWKMQEMVPGKDEEGLWLTSVRIGLSGQEEFQFARDGDWCQVIHPAGSRVRNTSVRVQGPDNRGHGRNWLIRGRCNDLFTIQLRILDGEITVTTSAEHEGVKTWTNAGQGALQVSLFSISGSWDNWAMNPMEEVSCIGSPADADSEDAPAQERSHRSVFQFPVVLGERGIEEFQLIMDDWGSQHQLPGNSIWRFPSASSPGKSKSNRLYPHLPRSGLGDSLLCGPDDRGHGLNWMIQGAPGQQFLVTLDPSQQDGKKVVWWRTTQESLPDAA